MAQYSFFNNINCCIKYISNCNLATQRDLVQVGCTNKVQNIDMSAVEQKNATKQEEDVIKIDIGEIYYFLRPAKLLQISLNNWV